MIDLDNYIPLDELYLSEYTHPNGLVGAIYHDLYFEVMIKLTYSNN